jgi:hypothetical protein
MVKDSKKISLTTFVRVIGFFILLILPLILVNETEIYYFQILALRLSEAMNPFLYILGSRQLKNEVFNFFGIRTGPKMVRSHENPALSLQEITRTTSADTQQQCFH